MADAVATAPAAPAPTNGSAGKTQAPSAPAPTKDVANGPQTPGRSPDGKFASKSAREAADGAPPPPVDDDPEYDYGDFKLKKSSARAELMRARQMSRTLTEAQKERAEAQRLYQAQEARKAKVKESGDLSGLFEGMDLTPEQEKEILGKYFYSKHVEPLQLTEEQLAARQTLQRAEAAEAKLKAIDEERTKSEQAAAQKQEAASLESEILEAAKAGRIPNSRAAIRRIAAKMEMLEASGIRLPIEHIAAECRKEIGQDTAEFLETADLAEIKDLIGEKAFKPFLRKVGTYLLGQVSQGPTPATAASRQQAASKPGQRLTPQQFLDMTRKR